MKINKLKPKKKFFFSSLETENYSESLHPVSLFKFDERVKPVFFYKINLHTQVNHMKAFELSIQNSCK